MASRSGYYGWRDRPESPRKHENRYLKILVLSLFFEFRQTYGSPSIHNELIKRGITCGLHRTARLMKEQGLRPKQSQKFRVTTDSKHNMPVAPNLLNRQFVVLRTDTVRASDITYIHTREGWLYLAVVMDLYSSRVVGWAMNNRIKRRLVMDALKMAKKSRTPINGMLFHSDRGSQYVERS